MEQSVVIKSNRYGIVVVLDQDIPYEQLEKDVAAKFKEAGSFFKGAQMAVAFEGRKLTTSQENELVNVIMENSDLQIACIVDQDQKREELFKKSIEEKLSEVAPSEGGGQFYRGTLRSGQYLEAETSIIILGDVNPGANVVATGNIVILGSLKGTVYAGGNGNEKAFVVALDMNPMQIRIGDVIARSADRHEKKFHRTKRKNHSSIMEPQIAFVEDSNIYIESITKDVLRDIPV